jgi:hypothetical protein
MAVKTITPVFSWGVLFLNAIRTILDINVCIKMPATKKAS